MKRKLVSILTALTLCLILLPGTAWAEETPEDKSGGWLYNDYKSANGLPAQTTSYSAGSGTITWEPTTIWDDTYQRDIPVSGRLTLTNAAITVNTAASQGIYVPVDTELVLVGTNTITVNQSGTAIMVFDPYYGGKPSLTIKGEGSLTINAAGGGDGIQVSNELNIVEGANVAVTCPAGGVGMFTVHGGISICDSTVKVKIAEGKESRGAIRAVTNGYPAADLTIENSRVTAINPGGTSMMSSHSISSTNSDVVAIGKSLIDGDVPVEGILDFAELSGGTVTFSGGTLYAENKYVNPQGMAYNYGYDLPVIEGKITATDSAVIYYKHAYRQLIQSGNNIQYASCSYDEAADTVTSTGYAFVMGTVEWNKNIIWGAGINNYNQILGTGNVAGNIIIPSGVTATIPSSCGLYNYGTITNNGTIVIENEMQNVVNSGVKNSTGTIINNGTITVKASGSLLSNGTVTNSGTLNIEGLYNNFPTGRINGGTINGVVLEYNTSVSPKQFFFVAHGNAGLYENDAKYMGNQNNTLLVGTDSSAGKKQTMTVPADAALTIQENCTLDASQSTLGLSWASLDTYLSVAGKIVVKGTLKLPADPDQEKLDELLTHISGTGQIIIGDSTAYPITVTGGTADRSFAKAGETVTLTPEAGQGEVFRGWTTSPSVTITGNTFTMPGQAVTVTAQYDYTVTFDSQGGSTVESQTVESGGKAQVPETVPTLDGFLFDGWYTDTDCETAYNFNSAVTGPFTLYAKWRKVLPDPPAGEGDTRYVLVMDEGVETVPDGLKDKYQTPEALESAMKVKITEADAGVPAENTAVYDVALLVSADGGKTWTPATKDNFPAGGLTITLPYPEGTDSGCTFTVVHMFTTSDFGNPPGSTETPAVTNTPDGIRFTVTGLSPVSVGWVRPASRPSGGGSGSGGSTYAVTVEKPEHGRVTASPSRAEAGGTVTLTVKPDAGYALSTLTVTDGKGGAVEVTARSGGTYTFPMPKSAVTVRAVFICQAAWANPYTDVAPDKWYCDAVQFVTENGLMNGVGGGRFGPNDNLSRAMLADMLYNREGRPAVSGGSFTDVAPGRWYASAVSWAAGNSIAVGYGDGRFGPDDPVTREQISVMLWRYAGSPAAPETAIGFTDAGSVSPWARDALRWAVEQGIVSGRGGGLLDPKGSATRAEAAAMLMRYMGA